MVQRLLAVSTSMTPLEAYTSCPVECWCQGKRAPAEWLLRRTRQSGALPAWRFADASWRVVIDTPKYYQQMTSTNPRSRRVPVFFYGSFIRPDVMARGGLRPEHVEVARLSGFDIHISPHACITPSDQHSIYGVLVRASHDELGRLYSMDGVGVFLPEAVLVQTQSGAMVPALCYIPPAPDNKPADLDYLERLLAAARQHGFPGWYLQRLERFREGAASQ
jgi:hypothetical protein